MMKRKSSKGFVGVDIVVSIIAIMIFTTLIVSLMYSNSISNAKLRRENLAIIYLTEIFENVGIATYDEVTTDNIDYFVSEEVKASYDVQFEVTEASSNENIIKKVIATISYNVGNKEYVQTMERIKVKE